jgi:hypothetical protein
MSIPKDTLTIRIAPMPALADITHAKAVNFAAAETQTQLHTSPGRQPRMLELLVADAQQAAMVHASAPAQRHLALLAM